MIKQQILDLIAKYPKHYSRMVQSRESLVNWVKENSLVQSSNFAEMIFSAINQVDGICDLGRKKKFTDITSGYRNCGKANQCPCTAQQVSSKVKESKSSYTRERRLEITQVRKTTNLSRYGVENVGQTDLARSRHTEYYAVRKKPKVKKLSSYQKLDKKYQNLVSVKFITPENEYLGVSNQVYYRFQCQKCNNEFNDYIDNGHLPKCRVCDPYQPEYVSKQENQVYELVKNLVNTPIHQSDKSIINPYELDIVIPDKKIAIEYCGLYWHSEVYRSDPDYHARKMRLCADKGYRLITIFEDEWTLKPHIVKSRLQAILGVGDRIYARECQVKAITITIARDFLETYHIQGHSIARYAYGCFYNGKLVAVMTLGHSRYSKTSEYELIRYASIGTVIGGAGKMLSKFEKDHMPSSLVSYCDLRWGTGNLYINLGFTEQPKSGVGYYYTDFVQRYHRSNYTKKRLVEQGFDPALTEHEIMRTRKMYRIWDCGVGKYIKEYK